MEKYKKSALKAKRAQVAAKKEFANLSKEIKAIILINKNQILDLKRVYFKLIYDLKRPVEKVQRAQMIIERRALKKVLMGRKLDNFNLRNEFNSLKSAFKATL